MMPLAACGAFRPVFWHCFVEVRALGVRRASGSFLACVTHRFLLGASLFQAQALLCCVKAAARSSRRSREQDVSAVSANRAAGTGQTQVHVKRRLLV